VLDIFSGTGNISYEFSARGANAVAVDDNISCTNFIARTAQLLAFDNLKVIHSDAIVYLKRTSQQFNIIFADPPYSWDNYNIIPELVFERQLLLPNGFLVIEHSSFVDFENYPKFYQLRNYGKVHFSIFAENL
jgi:16S rRNA G966 N2-methylase RsmD